MIAAAFAGYAIGIALPWFGLGITTRPGGRKLMDEGQVVEYYCKWCEKYVECWLATWVERVALLEHFDRDATKVKVEVSAKCPYCSAVLGCGDAIVELS